MTTPPFTLGSEIEGYCCGSTVVFTKALRLLPFPKVYYVGTLADDHLLANGTWHGGGLTGKWAMYKVVEQLDAAGSIVEKLS